MQKEIDRFESKNKSAYLVSYTKTGTEVRKINPVLKKKLREIVEQYEKDGTLPK